MKQRQLKTKKSECTLSLFLHPDGKYQIISAEGKELSREDINDSLELYKVLHPIHNKDCSPSIFYFKKK